jgi:hypothetical protein
VVLLATAHLCFHVVRQPVARASHGATPDAGGLNLFQLGQRMEPNKGMVALSQSHDLDAATHTRARQLVDACNESSVAVKNVLKALQKRLTSGSATVELLFALSLLEFLMNNVSPVCALLELVARKEFLGDVLVRLLWEETPQAACDRILQLIEAWSLRFSGSRTATAAFPELHARLTANGLIPLRTHDPPDAATISTTPEQLISDLMEAAPRFATASMAMTLQGGRRKASDVHPSSIQPTSWPPARAAHSASGVPALPPSALAAASHAAEEAAAARATEEAAAAARATEAAAAKAAEEARVAKEKAAAEEAAMEAEKTRRAQQMEAALADLATAQARVLRADQKLKAAAADEAEPGWLTDATHRLSAEDRLAAACVERETASDALCSSLGRRDPALPGSPVEPSTRRRRLSAESTASLQEEVEMQRNAHINLDRLTLRIDGIEMYTRPRLTASHTARPPTPLHSVSAFNAQRTH